MGYDISYHPISTKEMNEWYFEHLSEAVREDFAELEILGKNKGVNEFYISKYIDTMKTAAQTKDSDNFEKTHAYYLAVVQGFFACYYYTRGTAFSSLVKEKPEMKRFVCSWNQVKPSFIACPVSDTLSENYSGGIYIGEEQARELLSSYENGNRERQIVLDFYEQNSPVFIKALRDAVKQQRGLMEASEVVEPNPLDLNESASFSNLFNCDTEGALIYQKMTLSQLQEVAEREHVPLEEILQNTSYNKINIKAKKEEAVPKRSILSKLFSRK